MSVMASSQGASTSSISDERLYTAEEVIGLLEGQESLEADLLHELNCDEESESDEEARGDFTEASGIEGLIDNNIISQIHTTNPFGLDSSDVLPSHRDSMLLLELEENDDRNEGEINILPLLL